MKRKHYLSLVLTCVLLLVLSVPAFAATREIEPNDSSGQATEMQLNAEYVGNLSQPDGSDWYKFTLTESDMVSITFNYTGGNPRMRMNWYDSGNKTVIPEVRLWLDANIYPMTTNQVNLAPGTYYIHIKGYSREGKNGDYNLIINAENAARSGQSTTPAAPDASVGEYRETESNSIPDEATLLLPNTNMYGNLSDRNDQDWYRFTLPANGLVTLGYHFTSGHPGMRFQLYNSSGTQMDEWIFTSTKNTLLPFTSHRYRLPAGDYYLYVGDYSTESRNEDYIIRVNYVDESAGSYESEYNNEAATADFISIGTPITGNLTNENDLDYYQFTLTQNESVTVRFEYPNGNPRMRFSILDSNGNEIYKTDDLWKDATVYPYTTQAADLAAGTYYICISDYSVSRTNQDYTLTVLTEN